MSMNTDRMRGGFMKHYPETPKAKRKVKKVMGEYKRGNLHSGKGGPIVKDRKQAIRIALEEARRHG